MSYYLKDFAVRPSRQGMGVGTLLPDAAEGWSRARLAPGRAVSLELISTKEAAAFCRGRGFEEKPSDRDGPGMSRMIR